MSWSEYVKRLTKERPNVEVGELANTSGQTIGRWKAGKVAASPEQAVALARAFGDSPLNALVALGYITAIEARQRPAATPDLTELSNDELLELVRARMNRKAGDGDADEAGSPAPMNRAAFEDERNRPGDPDE